MQHFDLSIGVLCFCVFVSGSNLFLYCYYGGRSTIDIVKYPNLFFGSAWYKLPTEFQKYIIIMIANAQLPLHYHGFGVARLNLATFVGVLLLNISPPNLCYVIYFIFSFYESFSAIIWLSRP